MNAPDPETVREANRNRPPVDSWIDDAPITDRQLDVLRAELDNRFVAQFNKDVVRKLVRSIQLARAAADQLRPEYGIRADFTDTTSAEGAVAETLGEALEALDRFDEQYRGKVVGRELVQRPVGDWREIGDGRG